MNNTKSNYTTLSDTIKTFEKDNTKYIEPETRFNYYNTMGNFLDKFYLADKQTKYMMLKDEIPKTTTLPAGERARLAGMVHHFQRKYNLPKITWIDKDDYISKVWYWGLKGKPRTTEYGMVRLLEADIEFILRRVIAKRNDFTRV